MKQTPAPHDEPRKTGKVVKDKKPYQKPSFRSERVFETQALSCGKTNPTYHQCVFSRKSS